MQNTTLWRALLGVEKTVVEEVEYDEDEQVLVAHVRSRARARGRCGRCQRRAPAYDRGEGRRRWRTLDLGTVQVWLEAESPRVLCGEHGVTVAAVPWARHGAGHTRVFDEQVAWLATQASKSAVTELMRIAWRTVGAIITRVWADVETLHDRFAGLRRIGIDEISYKRGHRYLTVVVDHDTGRLVWAAPGRDKATLEGFFDALGEDRCAQITHVSADGAHWISTVVADRCVNAVRCADPFHVVRWATDALDEVRRQAWNQARGAVTQRRAGRASGHAKALKHARYALWKNQPGPPSARRSPPGSGRPRSQCRPPAAGPTWRRPAEGRVRRAPRQRAPRPDRAHSPRSAPGAPVPAPGSQASAWPSRRNERLSRRHVPGDTATRDTSSADARDLLDLDVNLTGLQVFGGVVQLQLTQQRLVDLLQGAGEAHGSALLDGER